MQSELPWNVAGIPPEAREAARASARREGLSVGEWLTRRILRSTSSVAQEQADRKSSEELVPEQHPASHDSVEMLARALRTQQESHYVWGHIEDQLNKVVRRVEQVEQSNSESSRAMTRARAEIDNRSREHGQAFDQFGARMANLTQRVLHIERRVQADTTRQALGALYQGLSRLAEQFAETENSAADRTAQLTTRIETVVHELDRYRDEAHQSAHTQANRLSVAESSLEKLEAAQNAHVDQTEEIRRQAEAVAQLSGTLGTLSGEVVAGDTQNSAAFARLESRLSNLENRADVTPIDDRLQSLERTLMDFRVRFDQSERKKADALDAIEGELRALTARMDASEKSNEEAIAELGAVINDTAPTAESTAQEPQPIETAPAPGFDAPAVAGSTSEASEAPQPSLAPPGPQQIEVTPVPDVEPPIATNRPVAAGLGSFLMAAGRTESIASDAHVSRAWLGKFFPAPDPADAAESGEQSSLRLFLVGGSALLVVAAIGATLLLGEGAHAPSITSAQREPVQVVTAATTAGRSNHDRLVELATSGNSKAQELLGLRYLDGDGVPLNEAEGAKWLARAAAHGEALAAYRLGTLYEHGHGVPTDPAMAVRWYLAAAKAGNRKAMHNLAVAYAEGVGVPRNPVVAAQWFAHAAELGLSDSQFDLGVLYERGMGVPQSLIDAYKWYAIAAAKGDPESRARIETLGSELGAEDRAAAEQAAAQFRAAPQNRAANIPPDAATLLGG